MDLLMQAYGLDACMCMGLFFVVVVLVVVLVQSVLFISILHCLKAPLSAQPSHANKSLLSLFDFANANQSLTENRAAKAPVYNNKCLTQD